MAAVCTTIVGCATVTPPPAKPQLPAKQWQADELIDSLSNVNEQFRTLRALARLDYAGPDGKGNVQEAVLVQRPDRLRLETLTFLGAVLIVTVNDERSSDITRAKESSCADREPRKICCAIHKFLSN